MVFNVKQNGRFLPLIFLPTLFLSHLARADETLFQPYFIMDSFSYSETVSVESALHGWKGDDFQSGERQWSWNWVELGVQYQHWAVGLVQRYDYDLRFAKETAEFYWLVANKKELPGGRQYDLDLKVNALHSSGIRFSYSDSLNDSFNYRVGIAYLQANYMLDGQVKGNATADSNSSLDYDFDAELDYHYTEDLLFDRSVDKPQGKGFALDVEFHYQVTPATYWQLQVRDLFTRIYWQSSPYTQGRATSDRKEYDEDGYVSFNPVLTGYEGVSSTYVQRLEPRWYSKLSHQLTSNYALVLRGRYQYGHTLYSLGGSYQFNDANGLGISYWPINEALEVNWDYHKLKFAVVADGFELSEVNTLWFSLSYGI
ncbi:MAG: hypothetical protein OQK77_08280 [Psychromonas sp.]|nr:hypothetical protein [Psychromonas sp.]